MTPNFLAPACMHPSAVAAIALGRQGHARRTNRPPSHGTAAVGFVSPASFNRGLWARLLRVLGS